MRVACTGLKFCFINSLPLVRAVSFGDEGFSRGPNIYNQLGGPLCHLVSSCQVSFIFILPFLSLRFPDTGEFHAKCDSEVNFMQRVTLK